MVSAYTIIVGFCLSAILILTLALAGAWMWKMCLASHLRMLPKSTLVVLCVCAFCATMQAQKVQRVYVDVNAAQGGDGTENHPFVTLQEAVDSASTSNLIVYVSSGIYKPVTIQNGPTGDREKLKVNFVCTNGWYSIDGSGSGWCVRHVANDGISPYASFRNCVFCGAVTGLVGGVVKDSVVANCSIGIAGGVISYSALSNNNLCASVCSCLTNCLVVSNGMGARNSELINCTVANNVSDDITGGVGVDNGCVVLNSAVVNNLNALNEESNYGEMDVFTNSCTMPLPLNGFGNVPGPACFRTGTFVPSINSPCIDAGDTNLFAGKVDFDGLPRVQGQQIDIGAYEYGSTTNSNVTKTTPVPIPHQWFMDVFKDYYGECIAEDISYLTANYARIFILRKDLLPARFGSYTNVYYESTGNSSGVVKNNGRQFSYWQEYLMGTNPLSSNDVFIAEISVTNGVELTWRPDLGEDRVYTVMGAYNLQDFFKEDASYKEGTNRFFKIEVDIPYPYKY